MKLEGERLAGRLFETLARLTADPPGVTRAAYGAGEQLAHDQLAAAATAIGLGVTTDAAGNLYMTQTGRDRSAPGLFIGSHLDTVPHSGNYDGAAGVIAGVAALAILAETGQSPAQDVTVMAIRAEEAAWFPLSYLGSKAALGMLPAEDLQVVRSDTGRSLEWHMREAGFDPAPVRARQQLIDPARIAAYLELHIEQGPVLADAGCPVGIVTAMNGGFRYTHARCRGAHAHSGAEPRRTRRDAVLGFADLVAALEAEWDQIEADGEHCTITFGRIATDPAHHSASKVAGTVEFSLDVRSASDATLDRVKSAINVHAERISAARGVAFDWNEELTWPVIEFEEQLMRRLEEAGDAVGVPHMRLPSGGGHDAATFAEAGIPCAMLFMRSYNGSHNPDEHMEMADFQAALALLARFVAGYGRSE